MTGVRPVVDYTIANLMYVAWDQIVNHTAKNRYLFGGPDKCADRVHGRAMSTPREDGGATL